jgi:hypothetical protein
MGSYVKVLTWMDLAMSVVKLLSTAFPSPSFVRKISLMNFVIITTRIHVSERRKRRWDNGARIKLAQEQSSYLTNPPMSNDLLCRGSRMLSTFSALPVGVPKAQERGPVTLCSLPGGLGVPVWERPPLG